MGRPNPVLTIWVAPQWCQHSAVAELKARGHDVIDMMTVLKYGARYDNQLCWPDLILYPTCWHDALFEQTTTKSGDTRYPYLDAALVAARKRRRERK